MRWNLRSLLPVLIVFGSTDGTRAEDRVATIPPELIVQRFAVKNGNDALVVPVKIAGKVRLFLVDTGCTTTIVDDSLPLGEPKWIELMSTAGHEISVKIYGAPEAWVGDIPLGIDEITRMDLKSLREVSDDPIEGILGMDFLGRYVVRVDCDRGEVLLLKSVPKDSGEVVTIHSEPGEHPEVDAWVSPQ